MKVSGRKFIFSFLYLGIAVITSYLILKIDEADLEGWIKWGTLIAIILLCIQTVLFKIITKRIISLEYLFLLFAYVFYMGQNLLLSIGYDFGNLSYSTYYARTVPQLYVQSGRYSLLCIVYIFAGILLCHLIHIKDKSTAKDQNPLYNRKIGFILIAMGAPLELYSFISKVVVMVDSGYLEAHKTGGGTLVEMASAMFFAGLILLMTAFTDKKQKCRVIYIGALLYNMMFMLTGLRAYAAIKILIFTYVYLQLGNRINFKSLIKPALGGIFLLYLFVVIRNSRISGLSLDSFNFMINENLILDVISEFSITGRVITMAFDNIMGYAYGKSILCGFLAVIPGWSHIFGRELLYKYYTFEALNQQNWGSAFASDFYFDFGFAGGIIACFIMGIMVCLFCRRLDFYIKSKNYAKIAMYSYFVMQLIYTVRSYVFRLPRYFLWFFIIYFILRKIRINRNPAIMIKGERP